YDVIAPHGASGCQAIVRKCARVVPGERVLVVSDHNTACLGERLAREAAIDAEVDHCVIEPFRMHGEEPPPDIAERMSRAHVIFGITKMSMAHSQARLRATKAGARYLSLPDYSPAVMASRALRTDFDSLIGEANLLADLFTRAELAWVTSPSGTHIRCQLRGRRGNSAPGVCVGPGSLASPPDAESNIAPWESGSDGIIVVDGSIPCRELGLLRSPITLIVKAGRVVDVEGLQADIVTELFDRAGRIETRIVAELGVGLNPLATLCGSMLEDEGCRGSCHFGIGTNCTIGGENTVPFHLDFVFRQASVTLDDVSIMEQGEFTPQFKSLLTSPEYLP
ncbi:MAG: aminopeptidase, partial [Pirellulaceae bacterium]